MDETSTLFPATDEIFQPGVIAMQPDNREQIEKEMVQRFLRVPRQTNYGDIVYEFTRDPALLQQYYELRQYMYTHRISSPCYEAKPTPHDKVGKILVARMGKLCVGGVRMIIKTPRSRHNLTLEDDGVDIKTLLPEYGLEHTAYTEYSCLVRLPEFRGHDFILHYHEAARRKAKAYGAKYIFYISSGEHARNYRVMFRNHKDKCRIFDHIEIPDQERYEGTKMVLSVIELDKGRLAAGTSTVDRDKNAAKTTKIKISQPEDA